MKGLDKTIKQIKKAGFNFVKVELEAQLNRGSPGYDDCYNCDGRGFIEDETEGEIECLDCGGEGRVCSNEDFSDELSCNEFIMERLRSIGLAELKSREIYFEHCGNECSYETEYTPVFPLTYAAFYCDGSVDSEFTFTIAIEQIEKVLDVINAFKSLADAIGNGIEVEGAGLHISVLPSGDYPCQGYLPEAKMRNFRTEVAKLLPALFISAASGNFTRGYDFRYPRVSSGEKYSAIYTHHGTCIEYRLFETCYQRPEAFFEFMGTIAKTLDYYIDPNKKIEASENYPVYAGGLKKLVETEQQVKVISKSLKHVIPYGYTMSEFIGHREIDLSLAKVRENSKGELEKLKKLYKSRKETQDALIARLKRGELDDYEKEEVKYIQSRYDFTPAQALEKYIQNHTRNETEEQFIANNSNNYTIATLTA